jgi:hypothetical protein
VESRFLKKIEVKGGLFGKRKGASDGGKTREANRGEYYHNETHYFVHLTYATKK